MQKSIVQRVIAMMLVVILCCSICPAAFAAEYSDDTKMSIQQPESEVTQNDNGTSGTEPSVPNESMQQADVEKPDDAVNLNTDVEIEPSTEFLESTSPEEKSALELYVERLDFLNSQASALNVEYYLQPSEDAYNQMMAMRPMAAGDQTYSNKHIHVIGWVDVYNGFMMPNGKIRDSFNQYALDINGDGVFSRNEMAYCIEPYVKVLGGNIYNSTETSAGSTVSSPWGKLNWEQQQAIGLTVLYGYPNMITDGNSLKQRLCDQLATAAIIHEIVLGWRNPYPPYNCTNSTYINAVTDRSNGGHFAAGIFVQNAGLTGKWIDYDRVQSTYDRIGQSMARHTVPSFAKGRPQTAPTYTMQPMENGKYTVTLTDTLGTLPDFRFPDLPGVTFTKHGNSVTIVADSYDAIPTGYIKTTGKEFPSAEKSAYLIWDGNRSGEQSQDQICLKPGGARTDPVPAYFKLAAPPTGSLEIRKTTEDGKNLAGWKFRITGSGVDTTVVSDQYGNLPVQDLNAGTYTVAEIGNTNADINKRYICASQNPQTVTVTAGSHTSVSFYNKLNTGSLQIRKTVNAGSLAGWKVGVYTDAACQQPVNGSPFTTPASGIINVTGLYPGTYYVREIDESGSYPNWKFDTSRKDIVVRAGSTSNVTISNTLLGRIWVQKNAVNGSPEGWSFEIRNRAGSIVETITTGPDGTATSRYLEPGDYTVREIHDRDENYWTYDSETEKGVTVVAGQDQQVGYTNTLYGRLKIVKHTNVGDQLAGWEFEVRDSSGTLVEVLTTGTDGTAVSGKLIPDTYMVTEQNTADAYWHCDVSSHSMTVIGGATITDEWTNILRGRIVVQKNAVNGSPEGWTFEIKTQAGNVLDTITTGSDGIATSKYLEPGQYTVREIHDRDDTYWTYDAEIEKGVTVVGHADTTVAYTNEQFGRIQIFKSMATDGPLDGWKFKITDSTGTEIPGSPFTSDQNGMITTGKLIPGDYKVEEMIPEDSLYYCKTENPQTITVKAGETVSVSFTNALRPGMVGIKKVDFYGNPLSGAKFCLEWSVDGQMWTKVHFSDAADVVRGGCNNPAIKDGCLITAEDGLIEWKNLYPGILYRITEVEAPDGYQLLTDTAWQGELPIEDLTVTLRVINTPIMSLPQTGSKSLTMTGIALGVAVTMGIGLLIFLKKRES